MTRWHLIASTPEAGAHTIEEFDTREEAEAWMKGLENSEYDCYYADLEVEGGYLRVEDEDGNG